MKDMDLIYGLILGDGSLPNIKDGNSRLDICHGPKQYEYILWKSGLVSRLGFQNTLKTYSGPTYTQIRLTTVRDKFWTELRAKLYSFRNTPSKTRKRITPNILKDCSIRTLLLWYLDDGHNYVKDSGIYLGTFELSYQEQELIQKWIYELTGAELVIRKQKYQYYLKTYRDAEKFKQPLRDIFPNIECMSYKLI
jgi:hypothetical protein